LIDLITLLLHVIVLEWSRGSQNGQLFVPKKRTSITVV
jgi:hypothetical protein